MILIILGAPGAGKGTLGDEIIKEYKIPKISTGDILRNEVKDKTPLGLQVKAIMEKGALVPDDLVTEILKNRVEEEDCMNGFILDGFPRTLKQAEKLEEIFVKLQFKLNLVLNLNVSEGLILKRLTNRRVCKSCGATFNLFSSPPKRPDVCDVCGGELYQRSDDNEKTIKNRLSVYAKDTEPLIKYYSKKGVLRNVDAEGGIKDIMVFVRKLFSDEKVV